MELEKPRFLHVSCRDQHINILKQCRINT